MRKEYELSRARQLSMFHDIIELNNIKFTTPYMQSISGQEICEVEVKSINQNEFNRIVKNPNINEIRKKYLIKKAEYAILVGRNNMGEIQGSINILSTNEITINFTKQEQQEKIMDKNKYNNCFISESVFEQF